jgi:AhpD family alkylhydroperoxidase
MIKETVMNTVTLTHPTPTAAAPAPLSFPSYTTADAPAASATALQQAETMFGFVPSPLARMAPAPALIKAFNTVNALWSTTSFSNLEREVAVLALAVHNGCHYCVAMHSAMLAKGGAPAALIERLRQGQAPDDPRLAALSSFVRALLVGHGVPSPEASRAFVEAGYTSTQALELLIGVGAYTISTFANRLTRAPLDPPWAPFAWQQNV